MTTNAPSKVKAIKLSKKGSVAPPPKKTPAEMAQVQFSEDFAKLFDGIETRMADATPNWDDIPAYVLNAFVNITQGTRMRSYLDVGHVLRISYYYPDESSLEVSLTVGKEAARDGVAMAVYSSRKSGEATYDIHGRFTLAEMKTAPNAKALYDHFLGKLTAESIGGIK